MNILLLGATGYLGGNIAQYLSGKGHHVICAVRRASDISCLNGIGCRMVSCDPGQIELVFRQERVDWIINGATAYKPNGTLYGDLFESNLAFPFRVLNTAVKYGAENFMTMGTGLPVEFNAYSFTKAKLSEFGEYLSGRSKINFVELRLEMFYGGNNEPDTRFMRSSMLKLLKGEALNLTVGTQKRDIIRMEDVLSLIGILMDAGYVHGYKVLPVGTGESHPVKEVIRYMAECCGSVSEINFGAVASRPGEPDTVADVSWYQDIAFIPKYSYFGGIRDECSRVRGGYFQLNILVRHKQASETGRCA